MASKSITELDAIQQNQISNSDNFVLEHSNTAMRMTAQTFISWAAEELDGHGGIASCEKTSTASLVDTYTLTFADGTTSTFTVTNGAKGDTGDTGATGATGSPATLTSSSIDYQKSSSGTIVPSGEWQGTPPLLTSGEFLWTRTTLNFNTGNPVIAYSVGSAGQDGTGTGTVTSVGITAGAGMSVSGSPVTTSGTITVGHSNSITAKTAQAVYPVAIDAQGHISSAGDRYYPAKTWTATLSTSGWNNKAQTLSSADFVASGYAYTVAPAGNPSTYNASKIYADDVTTNGQMVFHALGDVPTTAVQVNIMRIESV